MSRAPHSTAVCTAVNPVMSGACTMEASWSISTCRGQARGALGGMAGARAACLGGVGCWGGMRCAVAWPARAQRVWVEWGVGVA